jgi:NADPH:quinone reductase-like Zn-dependent oxidoreductase
MGMMLAHPSAGDLGFLGQLVDAGKLTPVIDRTYPLEETAQAIRYLEEGRARGKVVISIAPTEGS